MQRTSIHILSVLTERPLTVREVTVLANCTPDEVYYAIKQARNQNVFPQTIGRDPHKHFYLKPKDFRNIKRNLQDDLEDIINAGDAWTFAELADVLDKTPLQVRRAVFKLTEEKKLTIKTRKIRVGRAVCTQLQSITAEEPVF